MDNHKWALYVWEKNRLGKGFYTLIHVDYHWDANYDFWGKPEREKELKEASIDELESLIKEEDLIQYDSFIGPAVARGLINNIHFRLISTFFFLPWGHATKIWWSIQEPTSM